MIEALIDTATGNVIVVKPLGSVWGRAEVNRVVKLEDAALEAELAGRPHVVYPYAVFEEIDIAGRKQRSMVELSIVQVKVDPAEIQNVDSTKPGILLAKDADTPTVTAVIEAIKPDPVVDGELVKPDRPLPEKK